MDAETRLVDIIHPCAVCGGTGERPGYDVHPMAGPRDVTEPCRHCAGSGHFLRARPHQIRELLDISVGTIMPGANQGERLT